MPAEYDSENTEIRGESELKGEFPEESLISEEEYKKMVKQDEANESGSSKKTE